MQTAFERLIAPLDPRLSVLDVGYGGLDGENTTDYLRAHFDEIWGLSKDAEAVNKYRQEKNSKDTVVLGIYPQHMPRSKTFDLLVLDPNIESNLDFWSEEGMKKAWSFVNDGGYIITYIVTTDDYGDEDTHALLIKHRQQWWDGEGNNVRPQQIEIEERRPYITWVLLKKP